MAKTKFKIPFKIIEGSAESNIKDLQMAIDALWYGQDFILNSDNIILILFFIN